MVPRLALSACLVVPCLAAVLGQSAPTRPVDPTRSAAAASWPGHPAVDSALTALPRGGPPARGLVVDGVHRAADGTRTDLRDPRDRSLLLDAVTALRDGFLVADGDYFEGTSTLRVVRDGASRTVGPCTSGPGAATRDGRAWAVARFPCPESTRGPDDVRVVLHRADGRVVRTSSPAPRDANPLTAATAVRGEQVLLDRAAGPPVVRGPGGAVEVRGLTSGEDLGPGRLVLGVPSARGRSVAAVRWDTGRLAWSRAQVRPGSFSPDGDTVCVVRGRTLLGLDARTGEHRTTWRYPGRLVGRPVWEDDEHPLVVVRDRGSSAVVRGGPGGGLERASRVFPGRHEILLVR